MLGCDRNLHQRVHGDPRDDGDVGDREAIPDEEVVAGER
jgi:hypothetical protein